MTTTIDKYGYTVVTYHTDETCDDKPTIIKYDSKGTKRVEIYHQYGKYRTYQCGPAIISYYDNGQINTEQYVDDDGHLHHDSQPAFRWFNDTGKCAGGAHHNHGKRIQSSFDSEFIQLKPFNVMTTFVLPTIVI